LVLRSSYIYFVARILLSC